MLPPRDKLILVVDDDPSVLRCLRREFARLPGIEVRSTECAHEALRIVEAGEVDVLITDQRMPAMLGTELVRRASLLRPHLRRIIVSGSPADVQAQPGVLVMQKPWVREELMMAALGDEPCQLPLHDALL